MIHVRHAAAATAAGLCETVLIRHGESGRSGVGRTRNVAAPTSLAGPPPFPPRRRRAVQGKFKDRLFEDLSPKRGSDDASFTLSPAGRGERVG
jgi:hypothetical protein